MKKIILSIVGFSSTSLVFAQEKTVLVHQAESKALIAPILVVVLLIYLILSIKKYILDFRLKNKIVNKGISEQLSTSILAKDSNNRIDEAVKLAILFCGIGIGVLITYYTMPLHLHSLAIMAFSIGASYFAYFSYLKKQKK
jgi:hypothetical protein